jgi:hypothetical protein
MLYDADSPGFSVTAAVRISKLNGLELWTLFHIQTTLTLYYKETKN